MKNETKENFNHTNSTGQEGDGESIPMLLSTCVKYIRESLNARFAEAGNTFSFEQWRLLTFLARQDGVSQLDLARLSDRTEVSVLNLLKKLEERGLILRQRDPVDARSKRVFLTLDGRKKHEELLPVILDNRTRICHGLTEKDINTLKRILKIIINNSKELKNV